MLSDGTYSTRPRYGHAGATRRTVIKGGIVYVDGGSFSQDDFFKVNTLIN